MKKIIIVGLVSFLMWGNAMSEEKKSRLLEVVDGFAIVSLPAEGFAKLSLTNKLLAYHLYNAAVAGRDITFAQHYIYNLPIRSMCEQILLHSNGIEPNTLEDIETYLKLQFLNAGIHHYQSYKKITPPKRFTFQKLKSAIDMAIQNGAKIETAPVADNLENFLQILDPIIFDSDVDEWLVTRSPKQGEDVLQASAISFYDPGIKLSDLEDFEEKYPYNSTVVKEGKKVIEKVWRAGDPKRNISEGMFAKQISNVIRNLQKAIPYASATNAKSLESLIEFYQTGKAKDFDRYNIEWLKYNDPTIDHINGFIESYHDPREKKCSWEGVVFFVNEDTSHWLREVAKNADYYEQKTPFDPKFKRKGVKPIANMVEVLVETGDGGPVGAAGVNLPNDQAIRQKHGSKNVLLWNSKEAKDGIVGSKMTEEFMLPEDQKSSIENSDRISEILVGFHEALGHASGKASTTLKGDPSDHLPGYYAWLEEERADLLALHHAWDPKTFEIRKDWTEEAAKALYKKYVAMQLWSLAQVPEGSSVIEESHMVGENFAVNYFIQKGAVDVVKKNVSGKTKTYYQVKDENISKMRLLVAELLAELQRIKAEGDLLAIQKLSEKYNAVKVDPELVKELKERKKLLNVPNYYAYAFPNLEVIKKNGKTVDVKLTPETNFLKQQMRWSGYKEDQLKVIK